MICVDLYYLFIYYLYITTIQEVFVKCKIFSKGKGERNMKRTSIISQPNTSQNVLLHRIIERLA